VSFKVSLSTWLTFWSFDEFHLEAGRTGAQKATKNCAVYRYKCCQDQVQDRQNEKHSRGTSHFFTYYGPPFIVQILGKIPAPPYGGAGTGLNRLMLVKKMYGAQYFLIRSRPFQLSLKNTLP
jgi:hypothetical protein